MVTVHFFQRKRSQKWPKLHKIIHNTKENRDSTPILTELAGLHQRNIHTKLKVNSCSALKGEVKHGIIHRDKY